MTISLGNVVRVSLVVEVRDLDGSTSVHTVEGKPDLGPLIVIDAHHDARGIPDNVRIHIGATLRPLGVVPVLMVTETAAPQREVEGDTRPALDA